VLYEPYLKRNVQNLGSLPFLVERGDTAYSGVVLRRHRELSANVFGMKRAIDKREKIIKLLRAAYILPKPEVNFDPQTAKMNCMHDWQGAAVRLQLYCVAIMSV